MIKIIVIGPEQSGSTRLYNFIVNIYKIKNLKVLCGWDINISEYNNNSNYDVIVSKLHEYNNILKLKQFDYVLLPLRDIRDAYISTVKRNPNKNNIIQQIHKNINIFQNVNKVNNILCLYEDFNINNLINLCKKLNITLPKNYLIKILLKLDNLHNSKELIIKDDNKNKWESEIYRTTLLTQSHNTSGGKQGKYIEEFDDNRNNIILKDDIIYNFLKEYNYLIYENKLRLIKSNLYL